MALAAARRRPALLDLAAASFENTFVHELPADPVLVNMPRQVANACYARAAPTPVAAPRLLAWSEALGELLGLSRPGSEAVEVLAGNRVLPGMEPYAARYGGHQFGHWAGQLGDGRAITLAEIIATARPRQELPPQRGGKKPHSRTAGGAAAARP